MAKKVVNLIFEAMFFIAIVHLGIIIATLCGGKEGFLENAQDISI